MSKNGRFKLSTTESLYPPIEIEVDGKVYLTRRFSNPLLHELKALEAKAKAGDPDAIMKQIEMVCPIPRKILEIFDVRELQDLVDHIHSTIFAKDEVAAQKNAPSPGPKKSPKSKRSSRGSATTKKS